MKSIFTFIIITFSFFTFGQETKKVTIKNKEKDTKEVFHVLVSNDTVKHGEYKLFRNGKLDTKKNYNLGLLHGKWTTYYFKSRKKYLEGTYINGEKDGTWIGYYKKQSIKSTEVFKKNNLLSNYIEYNETGKIIQKGNKVNGLHFGEWEYLYNNKYIKFTFYDTKPTIFSNDEKLKEKKLINWVLNEKDTISIKLDSPIIINWTKEEYFNFIAGNITYPQNAIELGIEGTVYILLTIDEKSIAKDFKIIKGVSDCNECDIEALRVVKSMPQNWKSAIFEGKPISGSTIITISFKLE